MVKSCLDKIRELYAAHTPQEIQEAFAQNRRDIQEREELERLLKQRDDLDDKILHFERKL